MDHIIRDRALQQENSRVGGIGESLSPRCSFKINRETTLVFENTFPAPKVCFLLCQKQQTKNIYISSRPKMHCLLVEMKISLMPPVLLAHPLVHSGSAQEAGDLLLALQHPTGSIVEMSGEAGEGLRGSTGPRRARSWHLLFTSAYFERKNQ